MTPQDNSSTSSSSVRIGTYLGRLLLFCLPLVALFVGVEWRLSRCPNSYTQKQQYMEQHVGDLQILVLGSSHALFNIRPAQWQSSVWTQTGYNLANLAQTVYYDNQLLQKYLPRMPHLKVVVETVSYGSLQGEMYDTVHHGRDFFYARVYGFDAYAPWNDARRYSWFAAYSPDSAIPLLLGRPALNAAQVAEDGHEDLHHVLHSDEEEMSAQTVLAREVEMHVEHEPANIARLEGMARLCHDHGVSFLCVTTPVTKTCYELGDHAIYDEIHGLMQRLHQQYGAEYRDDSHSDGFAVEDFADADHLNSGGAQKYTQLLTPDVLRCMRRPGGRALQGACR